MMSREKAQEIMTNAVQIQREVENFNKSFDGDIRINMGSLFLYGTDKIANALGLTVRYIPIDNGIIVNTIYDGFEFCEVIH